MGFFFSETATNSHIGVLLCKNNTEQTTTGTDVPISSQLQQSALLVDKCCDQGEVWNISRYPVLKCQPSKVRWKPYVFADVHSRTPLSNQSLLFRTTHPKTWCRNQPHIMSLRGIGDESPYLYNNASFRSLKFLLGASIFAFKEGFQIIDSNFWKMASYG